MPSFRRTASRLVSVLPEHRRRQVRRTVRAAERRLSGSQQAVTYVVSPHPDDETLRLSGYVSRVRERTERRLVLVAITDGGASNVARKMGWSPDYEREFRRAEQAAAWSALTGGKGEIIRCGLRDGAVTPEAVRDALAPLNNKRAWFYLAAHEEDYHPDHRAVVAGARLLDPAHVYFSLSPLMTGKGKVFKPRSSSADAVSIAVAAYQHYGHLSVRNEFRALARRGHRSRVTEGSLSSTAVQDPRPQRRDRPEGVLDNRGETQRSAPVFVLGNQKSGSTAIAALLAECIGEKYVGDVLYRHKLTLKELLDGDPDLAALVGNDTDSLTAPVVKDNDFTFLYPSLARDFPRARFVFVVRDPRQNIRSVLNRVKLRGDLDSLSADQYTHLRQKLPGWHTILTGSSFGLNSHHYIDELADRWVRANEVYLGASEQMVLARYEDFDAAKRPVIERLAAELGRPVVNDISASQDHQFQPMGDRAVAPEEFFGQENLERIESRCAALMASFGYEPSSATSR
ncbi:MAG: PIG-L family deacetylase [Ornithinimicrobium sp.]